MTRNQLESMAVAANLKGLSSDGKILLGHIKAEFEKFNQDQNLLMEAEFQKLRDEFTSIISRKDTEVTELKEEVEKLSKDLKKAHQALDDADQYERRDSAILSGPALPIMTENEDTHASVIKLLKDHLQIEIDKKDINITHRLGPVRRSSASSQAKRNIYVKFVRRDVRNAVIRASKGQTRGATFFANESLTPHRRKMFHALRKMKSDDSTLVKGCSTMAGKIYAFTPPLAGQNRDLRHLIQDMDALLLFCRTYVQRPLDEFIQAISAH